MMESIPVNLQTMFRTPQFPFLVLSAGVTKSIEITFRFSCSDGKGCKSPYGFWFTDLMVLHVEEQFTYYSTSYQRSFKYYNVSMRFLVFSSPR